MIPWWALAVGAFGGNFTVWGLLGLLRVVDERTTGRRRRARLRARALDAGGREGAYTVDDVAVLVAAHNEEVVIEESLWAITGLVPAANVHVVSDGSTDRTVELAERCGVHVIATGSNVGKAGALEEAVRRFALVERFPVVLILDADTRVRRGYFETALPLFDDPEVVAVAGAVRSSWGGGDLSLLGKVLVCHRQRIYALTQRLLKMGQTWRRTNATHIVPGFASMYRTRVLPEIEMNPPGLVIEDFNMTFEIYRRRLGTVGFALDAVAETQDPDRLRDYVRQTRRWSLGLWQTVRRHPPRPSVFGAMLTLLLLELVTASTGLLLVPLLLLVLVGPELAPAVLAWPVAGDVHALVAAHLSLPTLLFGVLAPDFLLTCVVAVLEARTRFLAAFLAFPVLRAVDAWLALSTLPTALFRRSDGRWISPARRGAQERVPASRRPSREERAEPSP